MATEEQLERAVRGLRKLNESSKVQLRHARMYLSILHCEAIINGLADDVLELCSRIILKKGNTFTMFKEVMKCMIPKRTMPDEVVRNVLKWIFTCHKISVGYPVVLALRWVAGLLELGLAEEKPINEYYHLFMALLEWPICENVACWLVVSLTKPDDVDRNMVIHVLNASLKTKTKTRDAILWCFKSFKPECVPETVKACSVQPVLRLSSYFKQQFIKVQERIVASGMSTIKVKKYDVTWKVPQRHKRRCLELIPCVQNIDFGSSIYCRKETPVLEFTEWEKLYSSVTNIKIPCNSLSLLQNPIGYHILACGSDTLQSRFSFTLFSTLEAVVVDCLIEVPLTDQEELLDRICEFEEYIQQGIPVVSRFLASYLMLWDGITFLPQLMRLIPWITNVSSFDELRNIFLTSLYYVYISSDVNVKCNILQALGKLLQNFALQIHVVKRGIFFHSPQCGEDIFYCLMKFIESLCILGLKLEQESIIMLHEILRLYEMLVDVEEESGVIVRSVLPPIVVYYSLFSRNYANIERVCSLLLKYDASVQVQKELQMEAPRQDVLLKYYSNDFLNILWKRKSFTEGYIFKDISRRSSENFLKHIKKSGILHLKNSIPFICISSDNSDTDEEEAERKFIREFKKLAPNCFEYLKNSSRRKN